MAPTRSRMRLYSGPLSMFGAKAEIAARKRVWISSWSWCRSTGRPYEPKHPEVLRINPKRQVPVLIHGDLELFDSTQIFEYLEDLQPDPPLWPREPREAGAGRGCSSIKSDEVYFPHIIRLMGLQSSLQGELCVIAAFVPCWLGTGRKVERKRVALGRGAVPWSGHDRRGGHGRGASALRRSAPGRGAGSWRRASSCSCSALRTSER